MQTDNSPILWVLTGLVGAGKTSFARGLFKNSERTAIRCCLDDIIQMMSFYKYNKELDGLYGLTEEISIISGLAKGFDVIIDRTNLTDSIRRRFINIGKFIRNTAKDIIIDIEGTSQKNSEKEKSSYRDDIWMFILKSQLEGFEDREVLIEYLRRLSMLKIYGVYFDVDKELCLRRRERDPINKLREQEEKIDWRGVLERMEKNKTRPSLIEGFDSILTVDSSGKIIKREEKSEAGSFISK